MQQLLPPEVACYVEYFKDMIEKAENEIREDVNVIPVFEPYWDPGLRKSLNFRLLDFLLSGDIGKGGWLFS